MIATAFVYIILQTLDDSRKLTDQVKRYQAQDVSKEFLRRYPLYENQKLLIEDTTVGKRLVNILVEKPIYPSVNVKK